MEIGIVVIALVIAVIYGLVVTYLLYRKDKKLQRNQLTLFSVKSELMSLFKPFNINHPNIEVLTAFSRMSDARFIAMGGYGLDLRIALKEQGVWLDSHLYVASVMPDDGVMPTAIAYGYMTSVKSLYVEVYVVDPSIKYWSDANEIDILRRIASAVDVEHICSNSFIKVPGTELPKVRAQKFAEIVKDLRQNNEVEMKYSLKRDKCGINNK